MDEIKHICHLCGGEAHHQLKNGKWCCCESTSKCPAVRKKNSKGLKKAYKSGKRKCVFDDEARAKSLETRKKQAIKEAFTNGSSICNAALKKYMLEDLHIPNKCAICSISQWQGKDLVLELDHIDGNSSNNDISNLRLLCPNCHSQTDTFRGRSINTGKQKISDEDIINALKITKNVRQALIKLGLSPKGANYARAYKLRSAIQK